MVVDWMAVMALEVRVGDVGMGRECGGGRPRGVQEASLEVFVFGVVAVALSWVLEGEACGIVDVERDLVGVVGRIVVDGEAAGWRGEAGESGRRKGEVRGEPKERGDGLYVVGWDWR